MFIPEDHRRTLRYLCIAQGVRLVVQGHVHLAEDRYVNGVHIIGTSATTEPFMEKGTDKGYPVYTYTIHGQSGRLTTKLETITMF